MTTTNTRNAIMSPAGPDLPILFAREFPTGGLAWSRSDGRILSSYPVEPLQFSDSCGDLFIRGVSFSQDSLAALYASGDRIASLTAAGRLAVWTGDKLDRRFDITGTILEIRGPWWWQTLESGDFWTLNLATGETSEFPRDIASPASSPALLTAAGNLIVTLPGGDLGAISPAGVVLWSRADVVLDLILSNDAILVRVDSFQVDLLDADTGQTLATADPVILGDHAESYPDGTIRSRGVGQPDRIISAALEVTESRPRAGEYPWFRSVLATTETGMAYYPGGSDLVGSWLADLSPEPLALEIPAAVAISGIRQGRPQLGSDVLFESVLVRNDGLIYSSGSALVLVDSAGWTTSIDFPDQGQTQIHHLTAPQSGAVVYSG